MELCDLARSAPAGGAAATARGGALRVCGSHSLLPAWRGRKSSLLDGSSNAQNPAGRRTERGFVCVWLRGLDLNQRPSGYEPDELPDCSTPRQAVIVMRERYLCVVQVWRRPTLPCLETQYHGRWRVSRPSSRWDRVLGTPLRPPDRRNAKVFWDFGRAGFGDGGGSLRQAFWLQIRRGAADLALVFFRPGRVSRTRITGAIKSIGRLVPVGSTRHRACTPGLSTWSSSTALKGGLVLRGVSRLDAFSGYPVRT